MRDVDAGVRSPDGGWGWMVLIGSFISYFLADGWSFSFGVLFPTLLEFFGESKGKTSLIAALLYGIPLVISPVICALTSCYGCRPIAIVGGMLTASSMIIASFAQSVNQLYLTVGLFGSLGLAMVYLPALLMVTFYFEKRRGLATGLAVTGSGLGTICFPPIMNYLLMQYAWRGFFLIMGGFCLHIVLAGSLFRPLITARSEQKMTQQNPVDDIDDGNSLMKTERGRPPSEQKYNQFEGGISKSCTDLHLPLSSQRQKYKSDPCLISKGSDLVCETDFCIEQCDILNSSASREKGAAETLTVSVESIKQKSLWNKIPGHLQQFFLELQSVLRSTMFDKSLAKNRAYLLFCASNFIIYLWVGVPFIFLIDRAVHLGIVGDLYLLSSVIGIGRTVGQIIIGLLADLPQVSSNVLYAVSVIVFGGATVLVPLCDSYATLCIYAVIYGFFVSATYAIQMMCVVDIVGLNRTTSAFGFLQLLQGVATILGTPLAGWLYDVSGGYDPTFYTSGAWMAFSGVMLFPIIHLISDKSADT